VCLALIFVIECKGDDDVTTRRRRGSSNRRSCGAEEVVSERHQRIEISFGFEAEINAGWRKLVENLSLGDSMIALPTHLQARPQKAECQEWLGLASKEAEEPPASR
jgi:hypothetical protein